MSTPSPVPLDLPPDHPLTALVERARARQRAELDAAIERALEHVPRLLRGTLRKVLFS